MSPYAKEQIAMLLYENMLYDQLIGINKNVVFPHVEIPVLIFHFISHRISMTYQRSWSWHSQVSSEVHSVVGL